MKQIRTLCPGCGLELFSDEENMDHQFNASSACRKLFFELSYYTLELQDKYFTHQLAVDTYAAQHSGKNVKPIATAFALIGLYLVFEDGYTGKQVQEMHMFLAKKSKIWPQFTPPSEKANITVQDVINTPPGTKRNDMIHAWGKSVWDIWKKDHNAVEELVRLHSQKSK